MAKKKDGITDLTKLSVIAAGKLTSNQFKLFQSTIFSLLNGVQYGYTELGPQFLQDTNDIYSIHSKPQNSKKTKKVIVKLKNNKSNIIDFNSYRREDVKV
jgi:hypothetical protein